MKFITTFAQKRILHWYWLHQEPFEPRKLVSLGVTRFVPTTRWCLFRMERKHQIRKESNGTYISTTESLEEWNEIKESLIILQIVSSYDPSIGTAGLNRYEVEEKYKGVLEGVEALLQKKRDSISGVGKSR